jgi:hypothetical protein
MARSANIAARRYTGGPQPSDLADLLFGMRPGIPGKWNQGLERPIFDPKAGLGTLFGPVWRHFGAFWRVFGGFWKG